jgi:hypothetical protein
MVPGGKFFQEGVNLDEHGEALEVLRLFSTPDVIILMKRVAFAAGARRSLVTRGPAVIPSPSRPRWWPIWLAAAHSLLRPSGHFS